MSGALWGASLLRVGHNKDQMGKATESTGAISLILFGVGLLTVACGLTKEEHGVTSTGGGQSATGAGGSGAAGAARPGAAGAGAAGAAGASAAGAAGDVNVVCPTEQAVDVLSPSADCHVEEREIDAAFTCELDPCPITRALDLVGWPVPRDASMAVTADTTMVVVGAQRMTVGAAGASVEDVAWLGHPLTAADEQGNSWLFGRTIPDQTNLLPLDITAVRETEGRWMGSTVAATIGAPPASVLSGVVIVDDSLGYLVFLDGAGEIPHLVTWDGSCWTDERLVAEPSTQPRWGHVSVVVQIDNDQRPWVAWQVPEIDIRSLYLRGPDGDTQSLMEFPLDSDERYDIPRLRLLARGLEGTSESAALAVRYRDGIHLLTRTDEAVSGEPGSGWLERVLADSARGGVTGECPTADEQYEVDPCSGLTSCTEQLSDTSHGFGLARTESGRTFAAWVVYSSEASFALEEDMPGGEMFISYCRRTETAGLATADLVVARLTETEPVLTRFRFDASSAVQAGDYPVNMAARGETLLVAAMLSGGAGRRLTYLEIDSRLLP